MVKYAVWVLRDGKEPMAVGTRDSEGHPVKGDSYDILTFDGVRTFVVEDFRWKTFLGSSQRINEHGSGQVDITRVIANYFADNVEAVLLLRETKRPSSDTL
jgi:hypothetical protein